MQSDRQQYSTRFLLFMTVYTLLVLWIPPFLTSWAVGESSSLPGIVMILTIAFIWFGFAKANSWLVHHTPFGKVWVWAKQ